MCQLVLSVLQIEQQKSKAPALMVFINYHTLDSGTFHEEKRSGIKMRGSSGTQWNGSVVDYNFM